MRDKSAMMNLMIENKMNQKTEWTIIFAGLIYAIAFNTIIKRKL